MLGALVAVLLATAGLTLVVRAVEPRLAFYPDRGEDVTPVDLGTPFHASAITTEDRQQLRVWSIPHAQARATVLYFHGNGGNLSVWAPILVALQRQGYHVHALDYRGYGQSTGTPSEHGLYEDVAAFVTATAAGVDADLPLIYWGRSLGGTMAARAATIRRPDGVIVESGFPDVRSVLTGSPVLALLWPFSSYRFPTARFLAEAQVPVLVIHGDADRVVPFSSGRALFDRLPEPKSLHVIRGGDHNDLTPPDAVAYWQAVAAFINRVRNRD